MSRSGAAELQPDSWAAIHLTNGSVRCGVVYTVDPETGNIILLTQARARALPTHIHLELRPRMRTVLAIASHRP